MERQWQIQLDINRVGGEEVVIVVCVGQDVELAKALSPLFRTVCVRGGRIGEEESKVYKACGKDGLGSFDVGGAVDESGKGSVEPKQVLHVSGVGRLLAVVAQSTGKCSPHTDEVLEGLQRAFVEFVEWKSISSARFTRLERDRLRE